MAFRFLLSGSRKYILLGVKSNNAREGFYRIQEKDAIRDNLARFSQVEPIFMH